MVLNPDVVRSILLFVQDNLGYINEDSDYPNEHKEIAAGQIVTE